MEPIGQIHTFNEYRLKKTDFIKRMKITNKNDDVDISSNFVGNYGKKIDGMIINK